MPGYTLSKPELVTRLRRIEGQVKGITQMVEDDRYCIDVLTQISAATKALQSVALGLLDDHMRHCLIEAARSGPAERESTLDELTLALRRALRL